MAARRRPTKVVPAATRRRARATKAAVPRARLVLRDPRPEREAVLQRIHEAILRQPVATQAVISALVAEGRRFAGTPAGRRWLTRLVDSDLVRRGQSLWEASALVLFEEDADTVLPSALMDSILGAIAAADALPVLRDPWDRNWEGAIDADS